MPHRLLPAVKWLTTIPVVRKVAFAITDRVIREVVLGSKNPYDDISYEVIKGIMQGNLKIDTAAYKFLQRMAEIHPNTFWKGIWEAVLEYEAKK